MLWPLGTRRALALVELGVQVAKRQNGYSPGPDIAELLDALREGAQQAPVPVPPPVRPRRDRDTVTTAEAAEILGCQPRNVRSLAARGVFATAEQRRREWAIDRSEVIARAVNARAAAHAALAAER